MTRIATARNGASRSKSALATAPRFDACRINGATGNVTAIDFDSSANGKRASAPQCQVLERTQPCLPLGVGHVRTRTNDYIRHGTITLFAALNYLDGKLTYRTEQKHTHVEWLRFLKQIQREAPKDVDVHLIADNYCTHKHAKVKAWLARRQRFHMHFVPTSSSWMNLIERFFADLTEECVRAGSFTSVAQLVETITVYLAERNANPKPYRWKADGKEILAKIQRARSAMEQQRARQAP